MYSHHANDLWACGKAFGPITTVEAFQTVAFFIFYYINPILNFNESVSLCVLDLALPDHRLLDYGFGRINSPT